MISIQFVTTVAVGYLLLLFLIAYLGDLNRFRPFVPINANLVYALSLAVYCSSWTFYGAVGTASVIGLDYVAIYLGPCLVFLFGYPVMRKIIIICKQNHITSISDFISSRYGKSRRIGVLVTTIAMIGSLPYIALQLKAVSLSFLVLTNTDTFGTEVASNISSVDVAFYTGAILVLFSILFGTRHLDATEHHSGMVLAISFESIVKLVAILVAGFYALTLLFDQSFSGNFAAAYNFDGPIYNFLGDSSTASSFITKMILSMSAIILLPRQFQMTVVEAHSHRQFKTASWVMSIYLLLTTLIVIPIAFVGTTLLPEGQADLYVLSLPIIAGNQGISLLVFIGGLSAATGMVIVAVISLSTMICNDLVMPKLIRIKQLDILNREDLNSIILLIRRLAIVLLVMGAYGYFKLMDENAQLANIGLISFAAVVQFLPATICAIYWKNAHSKGVYGGLIGGFVVWSYTLMLPTVLTPNSVVEIWSKLSWLNPHGLFGIKFDDSLTHGVFWSLLVNVFLLIVLSLQHKQSVLENMQASRFFYTGNPGSDVSPTGENEPIAVHPEALRILSERIIGQRNTQAIFNQYEMQSGVDLSLENKVDRELISLTQNAIAGVIGSASAQKVISDSVIADGENLDEMTALVDETSSVLQFNRNLLHTTLENITHGISVVDEEMNLVIWNQRYIELFEYPENLIFVGKPISEVLEYNAKRGDFAGRDSTVEIRKRLNYLSKRMSYRNIRTRPNGRVIISIGEPMPNGGFVTTYEDITESVTASEMLRKANEELEDRVAERTKKLRALTVELEKTTRSKTHFLAAASHDLLQPINAARLFSHSILERSADRSDVANLAENVDQSLVIANKLLRALLDISKLDSGGIQANLSVFDLKAFIDDLLIDLKGVASRKGVELVADTTDIAILSDRQLLFSVMQNLVSNALRYTESGGQVKLAIEVNPQDYGLVKISVIDNGIGIEKEKLDDIFNEFYQIKTSDSERAEGLGLGLSIVERISRLLNLDVSVDSVVGQGSTFSIDVPISEERAEPRLSNQGMLKLPVDKFSNINVLCLDNDSSVLEAMQVLIEGWGCTITPVLTYKEGLAAFSKQNYQIVLADYRLDYAETGLDFLRTVKEITDARSMAPVQAILITAEQDESIEERALEMGFYYMQKPIEPSALKSLMLFLVSDIEQQQIAQ